MPSGKFKNQSDKLCFLKEREKELEGIREIPRQRLKIYWMSPLVRALLFGSTIPLALFVKDCLILVLCRGGKYRFYGLRPLAVHWN